MKLPTAEEISQSLEDLLRRPAQVPARPRASEASKPRSPRFKIKKVERKRGDRRNLLARAITGVSLAGLTVLLIVVHPYAFAFEAMFFVAISIKEVCDIAARNGIDASFPVALLSGLSIVSVATWMPARTPDVLVLCVLVSMVVTIFRKRGTGGDGVHRRRYVDGIVTIYAFLYVAWLFSFCLQIRFTPGTVPGPNGARVEAGAALLLMLIATTALSDVGCYFSGKLFGRHALAPAISPGKTIEGSLGGVLVSTLTAVAFGCWIGLDLEACAVYGVVMSVVAQLGDLWESMMKREAGVKDSGRALAGHGGALDRFDSFFFAMPVGYLLTQGLLLAGRSL